MLTPLRNQRGQAMMAMGIGFVAFIGITALAVDVAHMAYTAAEVQTVADAAATAAAVSASVSDGEVLAGNNVVNGQYAPNTCGEGASTCVELGIWDGSTFTPNPLGFNAARATVTVTDVPSIVAGIFGQSVSTVSKVAVAAIRPSLPFALGQDPGGGGACGFTQPCGPGSLKTFDLSNSAIDSGWAVFSTNEFLNPGTVMLRMPVECWDFVYEEYGSGEPMPVVDGEFSVRASYFDRPTRALADCVNNGKRNTFIVPYFDCQGIGGATLTGNAVGFETITIVEVRNEGSNEFAEMDVELSCATAPTRVALVQ